MLSNARRGLAKNRREAQHVKARLEHYGAHVMMLDVSLQSIQREEARFSEVIDLLQQGNR